MAADLAALEAELQRDPSSRKFGDLAREYQRVGRLDEAKALCEQGLQKHPTQWQARLTLAQIYLAEGRTDEARSSVEKILLALPDHVAANHLAADIFASQGDLARALKHYQVVDLFDPGRSDVRGRMADLQAQLTAKVPPPEPPLPVQTPSAQAVPEPLPPVTAPIVVPLAAPREEAAPAPAAEPQEAEPAPEVPAPADPEAHAGTIRMPAVSLPPEHVPPEAADPSSGAQVEPLEAFASFSDLLPEEEGGGLLGGELLEAHEQTLLELPKTVSPAMAPPSRPAPLAAAPSATPPEAEPALAAGPALNTTTLAELYAHQGFPEKAVEIYQRVLLQDPDQQEVKRKIQELKMRISGEAPELPEIRQEDVRRALRQRRVQVLEGWLRRVKEERHV